MYIKIIISYSMISKNHIKSPWSPASEVIGRLQLGQLFLRNDQAALEVLDAKGGAKRGTSSPETRWVFTRLFYHEMRGETPCFFFLPYLLHMKYMRVYLSINIRKPICNDLIMFDILLDNGEQLGR